MISCLITVRTGSTRLPNKCLLPFGDGNVLEHVIRRCKHFELRPIVCTTTKTEDAQLGLIAENADCEFYYGHPTDVQRRWRDCAEFFNLWSFHTVDCDDPYFCPQEVERSFSYLHDLKLHCVLPTKSSSQHALGLMGCSISKSKGKTEFLPEKGFPFKTRMTLDYEEDFWFLKTIQRLFDYKTPRQEIDDFLFSQPGLNLINSFRNDEWRANQCSENMQEKNLNISNTSSTPRRITPYLYWKWALAKSSTTNIP